MEWNKIVERTSVFMKWNTSLTVIISAVLLLELMMGVMFYSAQNFIQRTMERMVRVEMNAIYLCIRNKLADVEVTIDNMSWVVSESLEEPEWMFDLTKQMVRNNAIFLGSGVAFVPDYYPAKGRLYEPYSVRRGLDSIVTMQVGLEGVDATRKEYFRVPMESGKSHWSEPYIDEVGAKGVITTYSAVIWEAPKGSGELRMKNGELRMKNGEWGGGKRVGVVFADISLGLLEDIMNEQKIYKSTERYLVTGKYTKLAGGDSPLFRKVLENLKGDSDKTNYLVMMGDDGRKHHVFYTTVGGKTDWVLINILDDCEVFGRLRMMRMMLMLPLAVGLFFAWLIVWRSSHNLKRLERVNEEKERMDGELRVASHIQQSMLPGRQLHREDVDICGSLVPAREVGGDLFDYYIRDEKLFFCIGDVSGKGTPSAMVMGVIHSLFRSFSAHDNNPAHIMEAINESSCRENDSNIFVTMFIGVLDLPTGNLRYCDAGHDCPLILSNGSVTLQECSPHLPLAVFEDTKYVLEETVLAPGSTVFLYTDGLTEARRGYKQYFGLERTKAVLGRCAEGALSPAEIVEEVTSAVRGYVGGAEQSDDLTMLAIHYTPKAFESKFEETLLLKNDVREVVKLNEMQKLFYGKLNIESSLSRRLQLAVEEAVVNVIDYAYPMGTEGEILVKMLSDGDRIKFVITDSGVVFDPTLADKVDSTLSAEERKIGGLGIHLVRGLMDSINYEREGGKNILTLIKELKNGQNRE